MSNSPQMAVLKVLGIFLIYILGSVFILDIIPSEQALLPMQGLLQITFLLGPLLVVLRQENRDYGKFIIGQKKPQLSVYVLSILGWLGVFLITSSISGLLEYILNDEIYRALVELSEPYEENISNILSPNTPFWYSSFIIAVIPAIVEESIFRGYLQNSISALPSYITFSVVAVMFAVLHLNPLSFFGLIVISFYLSSLRLFTGSLIPSIVVHLINNSVMILLYNYLLGGDINTDVIQEVQIEQMLFTLLFGTFIVSINLYMIKRIASSS